MTPCVKPVAVRAWAVPDYLKKPAKPPNEPTKKTVWVDPGLGFAKTAAHNLALLRGLRSLGALGYPVLVGASRKSFIGALTNNAAVDDRLEGSVACAVWAGLHGAAMVRVHDVRATVLAMRLLDPAEAA